MRTQWIILLAVAVAAAAAGYFLARGIDQRGAADPAPIPSRPATAGEAATGEELLGRPRPEFALRDASGTEVAAGDFDGRVLLLNFWASWCAPCVEEMPMLSALQRDHADRGLQVVGIALDDPGRAQAFAAELAPGYPLLFGMAEAMQVGRRYGNRSGMLPYSVLVDRRGIVRWTYLGALSREALEARLAELL